jgi:carboxypeptidase Q
MKLTIKHKLAFILVVAILSNLYSQQDSIQIRKIFNQELLNGNCYSDLEVLCKKVGNRLSGSPQAQRAVEWAFKTMQQAGADTVYLQECMVPHWVRGNKETLKSIDLSNGKEMKALNILAIGGSIGTEKNGVEAEVIEVQGISGLEKMDKDAIKGKIVFFNEAMNPTNIETFRSYGKAVMQRWAGASAASKLGAVAVVVRSASMRQDNFPHTGTLGYKDSIQKIPACCVSTNDANWLSAELKTGKKIKLHLQMNCQMLPDEKSYNVIGEIRGSKFPKEYITVGGHLDSWDVGEGAHDDGAGVVQSIEVIRLLKSFDVKPKRSIRAVAFMNEENGGRGGKKYAEKAKQNNEKHIAAIESDAGGFSPRGFSSDVTKEQRAKLISWKKLFEPYGLYDFDNDGSGSDIAPLHEMGVGCMELMPDSQRYFDYHHTNDDVFENVNKRELELGAASMAAVVWLLSEYGF